MPITIQFTCTTPFRVSHKSFRFYNIFLEFRRVLHSPSKTYKENNTHIILREYPKPWNKRMFFKILIPCSLYHAKHIDSIKWRYCKVVHIDYRRFTWTKVWSLNAIPNICIHMKHNNVFLNNWSPYNIIWNSCFQKNLLICITFIGYEKLVTLMVKGFRV